MNVTVITQPQTTTYNVQVTREETTYSVAVSLQRGPIGPQGPQGAKGDKGDAGPAGLTWRMVWDAGTQYAIDDAVYYNGSSYYAVAVPTVGTAPDPAARTPWMELAIMGQKGDKGDTGAAGPAGAGVPDTSGATSGEVVRWNGTTTEWGQVAYSELTGKPTLGTAAAANTGTAVGNVPVVGSGGKLDASIVPAAPLSTLSGSLGADVALLATAATLWTLNLAAGTWLINANIVVLTTSAALRHPLLHAVAGTGAPTLTGQLVAETAISTTYIAEAECSVTFIAVCSAASTVLIQGQADASGTTAKAAAPTSGTANASGYTAVKIA